MERKSLRIIKLLCAYRSVVEAEYECHDEVMVTFESCTRTTVRDGVQNLYSCYWRCRMLGNYAPKELFHIE